MEMTSNKDNVDNNGITLYTKDMFYTQLLEETDTGEYRMGKEEFMHRDQSYKKKILQGILYLGESDSNRCDDWEKVEDCMNWLETQLEDDELLFGYTFHVSSNQNFDYTWSYMRKQIDKYASFLFAAKRFIMFVYRDISTLVKFLKPDQDIHIVFSELIDLKFIGTESSIKVSLQWNHFYHITQVANNYRVAVMNKTSVLSVINCSYTESPNVLLTKIQRILAQKR